MKASAKDAKLMKKHEFDLVLKAFEKGYMIQYYDSVIETWMDWEIDIKPPYHPDCSYRVHPRNKKYETRYWDSYN